MTDNLKLPSWLSRGIEEYFPIKGTDQTFLEIIDYAKKNNKKLRVKLGIDPTGTDIHLGHSILFKKLRAFQDNGHIAVLIIGDFTAQIGDPTGKNKTRVQLSEKQVKDNAKTYLNQLGMGKPANESILDFDSKDRIEIRYNSEWLKGLNLNSIIELMGSATVSQMLAKEEFNKRYTSQVPIALHEFLYPLLQGYDSVVVQSDIELGGTDQKFNIAIGRDLQRHFKQDPQFGVLLPILTGLDGIKKMSKSEFNTVGLTEDSLSMYSKLEKVPDNIIPTYFELLTELDLNFLENSNPRELQRRMALEVTTLFHGEEEALKAQSNCEKLFLGHKEKVGEIPKISLKEVVFPVKFFYLLSALKLFKSSSESKRSIKGGGVKIDSQKVINPDLVFNSKNDLEGKILQIGKKIIKRFEN
ncbi:tyrosine--tRNA ligase [Prochlorococcus marinus XMU1414]|uniref:Tyrosine--tRNA ligase n=1 Tax=Prochlorococcus marinus XMU1424 TaxID=2774497 RepID=A0A9D9G6E5_PROMR|nr:tyrosine--tRNA ligase [Prochlorococcus marinus]MBO8228756.1 tyrosine--tRNA ligase [Prochlorococcus marinus XMU1414]MBW3046236.1 tyrosine--tRNA ligase [Prochlorococcus marinus str. MU1414]MCR8531474.1 tyrosine--tRNA ligase [Prochlorococcus marinus XMU1420]MCR8535202.1 tyrosine--tRNA ligase [Prochlorococcus marinus XMU1424]